MKNHTGRHAIHKYMQCGTNYCTLTVDDLFNTRVVPPFVMLCDIIVGGGVERDSSIAKRVSSDLRSFSTSSCKVCSMAGVCCRARKFRYCSSAMVKDSDALGKSICFTSSMYRRSVSSIRPAPDKYWRLNLGCSLSYMPITSCNTCTCGGHRS